MTKLKLYFKKRFVLYLKIILILALVIQTGCATSEYNGKIAVGMIAGAATGALVGTTLGGSGGATQQVKTKNTIISTILFSLIAGGIAAWHYQQIEEVKTEISGRYARYRLCDPGNMQSLTDEFGNGTGNEPGGEIYQIPKSQIGTLSISLDDNTKWAYPTFRKRYLLPDRGENQVLSERYIWEIIKPGSFLTRAQNPQFFLKK